MNKENSLLSNEEYRKAIQIMLDQENDNDTLRFYYLLVQGYSYIDYLKYFLS